MGHREHKKHKTMDSDTTPPAAAAAAPEDPYACIVYLHECRECHTVTETPRDAFTYATLQHCGGKLMAFQGHRQPCACPQCDPRYEQAGRLCS